ncbi:Spo0E family sporulation regulatory protein-aspartic acid phosphatase [Sediminibacillus dalangtanensis]|uniref:Spo0E family sporulation regulatory protein-aspartic acid phosphatase n=1 Tax=Sediminibacillus dalangtanensis TaxID=2729421 RepID=A0ABX7VWX2_9BACI|nr:aspartyl-phosphate phosphatase Spo0E family protein [Sediminibacillus dalangtanensis]QTM98817.1 Spo0E family sporulation regulatory protein-aspartic acid phosphatase [Sediminibacillus dalangtanensis]
MKKDLEREIEQLRLKMYKAYSSEPDGNEVLKISQALDKLLNEFQKTKSIH